ncbi:myotubularin-related protein 4-like [Planoprotostelium fungivorum]|uniref:Myotubularin-related protein 4-like n=1 Tax=Planoprotostelium fungivorum TaxID=1890364 RepID=A0A2P6NYY0_9EUKA|nr:myotubularin-related protein 4-like [Planoprotostelium fungivorum]
MEDTNRGSTVSRGLNLSGPLEKRGVGALGSKWKSRLFALGEDKIFYYDDADEHKTYKGCISFSDITGCSPKTTNGIRSAQARYVQRKRVIEHQEREELKGKDRALESLKEQLVNNRMSLRQVQRDWLAEAEKQRRDLTQCQMDLAAAREELAMRSLREAKISGRSQKIETDDLITLSEDGSDSASGPCSCGQDGEYLQKEEEYRKQIYQLQTSLHSLQISHNELRSQYQDNKSQLMETECDLRLEREVNKTLNSAVREGIEWIPRHKMGRAVLVWQPDSSRNTCTLCNAGFWLFRRRHHCRGCGFIFCFKCCNSRHDVRCSWRGSPCGERVPLCVNCRGDTGDRKSYSSMSSVN